MTTSPLAQLIEAAQLVSATFWLGERSIGVKRKCFFLLNRQGLFKVDHDVFTACEAFDRAVGEGGKT